MKTPKTPIRQDRRMFIQAGGLMLAIPFFESLLPRVARAATVDPRRYVCMYMASGTYMKENNGAFWHPSAVGPLNAANLPDVFKPFAANASHYSIIRGITNSSRQECRGTGGDHSTAVATYLTCSGYSNGGASTCTITGSSFDQQIAAQNNLKAYAMSAGGDDSYRPDNVAFDYGRTVSYLNSQQAETWLDPYKLFFSAGLFQNYNTSTSTTTTSPSASSSPFVRNKSILDNAVAALNSLKSKLGAADKQRLDDYLTGLRAFETTLASQNPTATPATCGGVAAPDKSLNLEDHSGSRTDFPARLKAFCDIMILAFKCDRAQVFSFMFEYENTNRRFLSQIPAALVYGGADMNRPGSHNEVAHWGDGGADQVTERRNRCVSRDRFYMSYVDYLITELKKSTDASGSPILDNTIIQFGHGLEEGNHNMSGTAAIGLPLVLAGGKNMLSPGNFYNLQGSDLKDLYYTLNMKLGMGLSNFRGSSKLLAL